MPTSAYPTPLAGTGPFGLVPGLITPPSPASDLAAQYPGLKKTNAAASDVILSKLGGNISPGTMKALQDASARFGVASGMPLSGLATNQLFGNIAGFAEKQAQEGLQDYASIIPTVSKTQTLDPALQAEIQAQNALSLAAPSPQQAQSYAQDLFNKYLQKVRGPGGGTTGAVGAMPRSTSTGSTPFRDFLSSNTPVWDTVFGPLGTAAETPSPLSIPTGNLSAGGPGTGTGQVYMGSAAGYSPQQTPQAGSWRDLPDPAAMSDEDILNWLGM